MNTVAASYSTSTVPELTVVPTITTQELPADRFKRLATARTNKAIKAISLLKNLSNRSLYSYSQAQVEVIIGALVDEVESVQAAFEPKAEQKVRTITLLGDDTAHAGS